MTEQEKELLLKDLCARLPYHPNCYCKWLEKAPNGTNGCVQELSTFVIDEIEIMDDPQFKCQICDVKPYLRPMSSMTKEEKAIYSNYKIVVRGLGIVFEYNLDFVTEWLIEHHFDYRGLIEKGLAIEAPEGMYDEKKEEDKSEQIPDTIEAAIAMLDTLVSDEDKEYILENGSISVHHSLGRWIRNNWGLWEGGELKECLRAKGIEHPDDMSDYIIQRFIDHIKK